MQQIRHHVPLSLTPSMPYSSPGCTTPTFGKTSPGPLRTIVSAVTTRALATGIGVAVPVGVAVGSGVGVMVGMIVAVAVGVGVMVGVGVIVLVGRKVAKVVGAAVGVGATTSRPTLVQPKDASTSRRMTGRMYRC